MEADVSTNHLMIRRTGAEHFTLVRMDEAQRKVTEKHCSGNLEEVIERLLDQHEKTRRQAKIARDYGPVLAAIRNLSRGYPCLDREDFPADWTDPLELFGCLVRELARVRIDTAAERRRLTRLIFDCGPEWVWKNRLRLVAERILSWAPDADDDEDASPEACGPSGG